MSRTDEPTNAPIHEKDQPTVDDRGVYAISVAA